VLSQIFHHFKAVDLFGSNDCCQGLIWDNHASVDRALEIVVLDVVPGQPHNLTHGGSLHANDCHQVLVNLQPSSQVPVALVASPVPPLSSDPESCLVDSILAFDQMITVVEPPSLSDSSSLLSSLHFVIFLRLKYQSTCYPVLSRGSNGAVLHFPRNEPLGKKNCFDSFKYVQ